jgi:hypothetical protein
MARKKRFTPENFGFIEAGSTLCWVRRVSRRPFITYHLTGDPLDRDHYSVTKISHDPKDTISETGYNGRIPDDEFAAKLFENMGMLPFTGPRDSSSD